MRYTVPHNRALLFLLLIAGWGIPASQSFGQDSENALVIPPVIYLTAGVETRIYYDNVVNHTEDHQLGVACDVGIIGEEHWSFLPVAADEGLYLFTIQILDMEGMVVHEEHTVLCVLPVTAGTDSPRILIIGDSLTRPGSYQSRLASHLSVAGVSYSTIGTVSVGGFNFEGYGGNTYQRYLDGPYYFRSPFVYADTGFDPERYFDETSGGVTPTLFVIFLGINDTFSASRGSDPSQETRLNEVMVRANTFIEGMRSAAPGSDVAIILTPAGSSQQESYDAAYGEGVYTAEQWQDMRLKLVARYIEEFGNRENEGIFLVPVSVGIDRLADYTAADPIHPKTSGYEKIGDIMYGWLNYFLQEHAYPRWALGNLSRELILAGKSDPDDNPDGDPYDNRAEHIFNMDPGQWSRSPLTLTRDGLSTRHLDGAAVILESTMNLTDWDAWEGTIEEESVDGFMQKQVPLESLTNQFFRLRY